MTSDDSGHASDARGSPEWQILLRYATQLMSLSRLFLYELDLRTIEKTHIDGWETELRGIIKGVEHLSYTPYINAFVVSCDGVQDIICKAIDYLYVASDILERKNFSRENRKEYYRAFRECSKLLFSTVDLYFDPCIKDSLSNQRLL